MKYMFLLQGSSVLQLLPFGWNVTANAIYSNNSARPGKVRLLWAVWIVSEHTEWTLLPSGSTAFRCRYSRVICKLSSAASDMQVVRGRTFEHMLEVNNCTHHYWVNENPEHAFFQRCGVFPSERSSMLRMLLQKTEH